MMFADALSKLILVLCTFIPPAYAYAVYARNGSFAPSPNNSDISLDEKTGLQFMGCAFVFFVGYYVLLTMVANGSLKYDILLLSPKEIAYSIILTFGSMAAISSRFVIDFSKDEVSVGESKTVSAILAIASAIPLCVTINAYNLEEPSGIYYILSVLILTVRYCSWFVFRGIKSKSIGNEGTLTLYCRYIAIKAVVSGMPLAALAFHSSEIIKAV